MAIEIRPATLADQEDVSSLIVAAFGGEEGPVLAQLVIDLVADPSAQPALSLVASAAGGVVGHILFTNTRIEPEPGGSPSAILAPMAVKPEHQKLGIGGRLIQHGLDRLQVSGVGLVFVLGHPGYYPRHGFTPAGAKGFIAHHPIPPEHAAAWMVQELRPEALGKAKGRVVCADALAAPEFWVE